MRTGRGLMSDERLNKVLVIDDSPISLDIQSEVLHKAGFDVRAVSTLDEFSALLKDWVPDIILADVQMPGMTGVELCSALKGQYETAHVPVVLCSGLPREELARLAEECEADGYLSKSDGIERLPDELRLLGETVGW